MGTQLGSGTVGITSQVMQDCCSGLRKDVIALEQFISQLSTLEQNLSNYWEGEDMDEFHIEFANFAKDLQEMPPVIESIAAWGESAEAGYDNLTNDVKKYTYQIFGK